MGAVAEAVESVTEAVTDVVDTVFGSGDSAPAQVAQAVSTPQPSEPTPSDDGGRMTGPGNATLTPFYDDNTGESGYIVAGSGGVRATEEQVKNAFRQDVMDDAGNIYSQMSVFYDPVTQRINPLGYDNAVPKDVAAGNVIINPAGGYEDGYYGTPYATVTNPLTGRTSNIQLTREQLQDAVTIPKFDESGRFKGYETSLNIDPYTKEINPEKFSDPVAEAKANPFGVFQKAMTGQNIETYNAALQQALKDDPSLAEKYAINKATGEKVYVSQPINALNKIVQTTGHSINEQGGNLSEGQMAIFKPLDSTVLEKAKEALKGAEEGSASFTANGKTYVVSGDAQGNVQSISIPKSQGDWIATARKDWLQSSWDASGKAAPTMQSNRGSGFLSDIAPAIGIASLAFPQLALLNAAIQLDQGNTAGGLASLLGGIGAGFVPGVDPSTAQMARTGSMAIGGAQAIENKDLAGVLNAGMGIYGNQGGTIAPEVRTGINAYNLAQYGSQGNIPGILSSAGNLTSSPGLVTAGNVARGIQGLERGDVFPMINAVRPYTAPSRSSLGLTGSNTEVYPQTAIPASGITSLMNPYA